MSGEKNKKAMKTTVSSQSGRIDQAFWIAWANMANGKAFEEAVAGAVMYSGLEPAAKSQLVERLKRSLSSGAKPKVEDLPLAYRPAKKIPRVAMIPDEWGKAVNAAKEYCEACVAKKEQMSMQSIEKMLVESGFEEPFAKQVAETVIQYYRAASHSKSEAEASAKGRALAKDAQLAIETHPLDEKAKKEWFGIKVDAGNYHQQVRGELADIIQDIWKVSEKNFAMVDQVLKMADSICRSEKGDEIIAESKADEDRPRFCAEKIYCIMKDRIRKS